MEQRGIGLMRQNAQFNAYVKGGGALLWPGQALGYKIGMLKLVELRQLAKKELASKFDIKAFHDLVLLKGARPLNIVEQDVNNWISSLSSDK